MLYSSIVLSLLFEDAIEEIDILFSQCSFQCVEGSTRTIEGVNTLFMLQQEDVEKQPFKLFQVRGEFISFPLLVG